MDYNSRSINLTHLFSPLSIIVTLFFALNIYGNSSMEAWCSKDAVKEFSHKLETEVKKGITVELVGIISQKDQLLCRKSISLTYDLWDEVVRVVPVFNSQKSLKISELKESICQLTYCLASAQKIQGPSRFRILLNPLWEERVAKVLQLNPNIKNCSEYKENYINFGGNYVQKLYL